MQDTEGALGPYLRALRAHRLAVALTVLAALVGSMAWLQLRTPDYKAEAEILVTPLPEGNETFVGIPFLVSSGDPTRTVQTAATLISSRAASEETANKLGRGLTTSMVTENIVVKPKGESNVLSVEATAPSATLARDMANTFARSSLDIRTRQLQRQIQNTIGRLQQSLTETRATGRPEALAELSTRITALENVRDGNDPTLSIAEDADRPGKAVGAPSWLIIFLALVAGVILGLVLALLLEMAERRVRDEDDLLSIYPLPVLTRVPLLSRRQLRNSSAAMPPQIREAFRTLQAQLEVRGEGRRCVMVTSASRNDGKTTSAINLALSLTTTGQSVLLIDFDLRKPEVASRLGITDVPKSLSAMLSPDMHVADLLVPAPRMPLLQVATAAHTEGDVAMLEALLRMMPRILEEAADLADYVIVDTAPLGEVADALKVADQVDDVLLVSRPGHTNRVNLEQARDLLESAGRTPTGLVVVGERSGGSSSYYAYGAPSPERKNRLSRLTAR
jgi:capsular exopolysaccharide synthesis family protein